MGSTPGCFSKAVIATDRRRESTVKQKIASPSRGSSQSGPDGRIRLACVITDLEVGGAERALVELATRLDRGVFDVRVWGISPATEDDERSLLPVLQAANIPAETLDADTLRAAPRVVRALANAWRDWRPDVVQTFLFHANILGRLAAWRARVPHVVSGIRVAERRGRWRLQLDRWTDRLVERHVCVSQSVADFSHTIGGLSAAKLLVIPNGVDIARYATAHPVEPSELGLPAGRRWITYIGRLDRQKGLAWLIEQTPTWFAAHPQHDLLLVGDGAERAELTQLISRVAPPGRVHLVGWQSNVPGILRASDLMVLPSRWEGMPNVVLEAMAAGRSVLAADVEGVRELLGSAAGPQIAHLEDTNDWGAKLTHLLADPQLAAELGAGNQARARDHFSLEASVLAYASLYTKLVGASNAPASTSDLA